MASIEAYLSVEQGLANKLTRSWFTVSNEIGRKVKSALQKGDYALATQIANSISLQTVVDENLKSIEYYTRAALLVGATRVTERASSTAAGSGKLNDVVNKAGLLLVRQILQDAEELLRDDMLQLIADVEASDDTTNFGPTEVDPFQLRITKFNPDQPRDEQGRWTVTGTPEFREWFGESKVRDPKGAPLVVLHGTGETGIEEFRTDPVAWFGVTSVLADQYSGAKSWNEGQYPTVYPVWLSVKKPITLKFNMNDKMTYAEARKATGLEFTVGKYGDEEVDGVPQKFKAYQIIASPGFVEAAQKAGYDGIKVKEGKSWTWGVFKPEQIKSALGNTGAFDPKNPSITKYDPDQPRDEAGRWTDTGVMDVLEQVGPDPGDQREKAREFLSDNYGDYTANLPAAQGIALGNYTGIGYRVINEYLRSGLGSEETLSYTKEHVAALDKAIEGAPPLKESLAVYRGMGGPLAKAVAAGDEFVDNGFTSTSLSSSKAADFAFTPGEVVARIIVPAGYKGLGTGAGTENEFILARGTKFRVLSVQEDVPVSMRVTEDEIIKRKMVMLEIVSQEQRALKSAAPSKRIGQRFVWRASDVVFSRGRATTKYDPDQPRSPAGTSEGGQWARSNEPPEGKRERFDASMMEDAGVAGLNYDQIVERLGSAEAVHELFDKKRVKERAWDAQMMRALAMGTITPESAAKQGFFLQANLSGAEKLENLPDELYHVTTAVSAVMEHGLKTREELGQGLGRGLGGGTSDTISFTEDKGTAVAIENAMLLMHDVLNEKVSLEDLIGKATLGEEAKQPYMDFITRIWGGAVSKRGIPLELDASTRNRTVMFIGPLDKRWPKDTPFSTDPKIVAGKLGGSWQSEGEGFYSRPATEVEQTETRMRFVQRFLAGRENAGGALDPLFFMTDAEALKNIGRQEIKVLQVSPKKGTRGYKVSSLGEWRAWTGDVVETVRTLDRKTVIWRAEWQEEGQPRYPLHLRRVSKELTKSLIQPFVSFRDGGRGYMQMVSALHTTRVAAYGFTSEAEILGVERYAINEQLDNKICPVCRAMHGRTFTVVSARNTLDVVLSVDDPQELRTLQSWPSQRASDVEKLRNMTEEEVVARNWHIPPFHPFCRGQLVPLGQVPNIEDTPSFQAAFPDRIKQPVHTDLGIEQITSAPPLTGRSAVQQAHETASKYVLNQPDSAEREYLYAFNRSGEEVLTKGGTKSYVDFTMEEAARLSGTTVYHNHPMGRSLSDMDMLLASNWGIDKMLALTSEGTTYAGRVKEFMGNIDAMREFNLLYRDVYQKAAAEFYSAIRPFVQAGRVHENVAAVAHTHFVNQVMHRYGLLDYVVEKAGPGFLHDVAMVEGLIDVKAVQARIDVLKSLQMPPINPSFLIHEPLEAIA
jgi:hypothetical protein